MEKTWNFQISKEYSSALKIAIGDLKEWFKVIFQLQKLEFVDIPVSINESYENIITINIDIFRRYDDTISDNDGVFYIRTDFFEDNKNNYLLENDTRVNYNLNPNNKDDYNSLRFVLKNCFEFDDFKEKQLEIICNILNNNTTIGILGNDAASVDAVNFVSL